MSQPTGQLYIPRQKIVVASSVEGVLNNGARECGFNSLNAFERMLRAGTLSGNGFLGRRPISPKRFRESPKISDSTVLKAFLALRPLVGEAEDYLTVLMAIRAHPKKARQLAEEPSNATLVSFFTDSFEQIKSKTAAERAAFRPLFYEERDTLKERDYRAWLSLQAPFAESIVQLRELNQLKETDGKTVTNGFVLSFVTSKDRKSTHELCVLYSELSYFEPGEVLPIPEEGRSMAEQLGEMKSCLITQERIIGKEQMEGKKHVEGKIFQMQLIATAQGVEPGQVWRLNDMFDEREADALRAAGFVHQFMVTGGYAFPQHYELAAKNGVVVVERPILAATLSEYARENGF